MNTSNMDKLNDSIMQESIQNSTIMLDLIDEGLDHEASVNVKSFKTYHRDENQSTEPYTKSLRKESMMKFMK
jgi:hypothetical protein